MLTEADQRTMAETGLVPKSRLFALEHALRSIASDARTAARNAPDVNSQAAAALRGKALAYTEAALMVRHIAAGCALHPRRNSSEREKRRLYWLRRRSSGVIRDV